MLWVTASDSSEFLPIFDRGSPAPNTINANCFVNYDGAFEVLDKAHWHYNRFEECCSSEDGSYTAPLVRLVQYEKLQANANDDSHLHTSAISLAEDWPWWRVQDYSLVVNKIKADPRWNEWVERLKG